MRCCRCATLCFGLASIVSGQIQPSLNQRIGGVRTFSAEARQAGMSIKAIAAGGDHSLALASDGTVWAWGKNLYGQLGDGTRRDRSTPVRVSRLGGVVGIAAGGSHGVALKTDGTVWAWGWGEFGQLGDETATDRWTPVQVSGLTGVVAIAAGGVHSLALKRDGTVWAWGSDRVGQLGDGTTIWGRPAPVQVSGLTGIAAIAAGGGHSLALTSNGTLWAWGQNESGQLGNGTTTDQLTPVQVSGLNDIVTIAAGGGHSLAVKRDGAVLAWGGNYYGQLGDGTNTNRSTPVQVSGVNRVVAIAGAGGTGRSLAVKEDGTVWAWGGNMSGELGDATTTTQFNPVRVAGLAGAVAVAGGNQHSLALKGDGTIWAWGGGPSQFGDGAVLMRPAPTKVPGLAGVVAVAGRPGNWALKDDGTVWEWGGWRADLNEPSPAQIPGLVGVTAIAGGDVCLAVTDERAVWQWEPWKPATKTLALVSGLSGVVAVSAGIGELFSGYNLALKDDGTVWEWFNGYQRPPSPVGEFGDVVAVSACVLVDNCGLALKRDGTLWQWTTAWFAGILSVPARFTDLSGVKAIAGSLGHNVALKNDGTVWEWAMWAIPGSTPVQVSGLTGVAAVAMGESFGYRGEWRPHTLALKPDGTVWAWGDNSFGQLGDGTAIDRPTPVQVTGLAGVVAIAAGSRHSLAVKSDGTVWEWGSNDLGQLSDERPPIRTTPVQVVPPGSPDLALEMSHDGVFTAGTQGVYVLTITNIGSTATVGEVTVTDTLPPGLAYVSGTGSDWTCSAAGDTVTCTNPGSFEPGASSIIALAVDIGSAAYPGVTNLATVTNASDLNISNNTIGDPTVVLPKPL